MPSEDTPEHPASETPDDIEAPEATLRHAFGRDDTGFDDEPERFGPYVIEREIGRGGQAVVYAARDERLGRRVALKVLHAASGITAAAMQRFVREAKLASRLEHGGICPVYESGFREGVPYIVLPFIEGRTLADRFRRGTQSPRFGELDAAGSTRTTAGTARDVDASSAAERTGREATVEVLSIVEKIAHALHAAHEAGVTHRDIKPGNIMITVAGEPVILDFGLARDERTETSAITAMGDVPGTPAYMSPEQLSPTPHRTDRRTDIWSLGVTLYEGLAGRRPFEGPTRHRLCDAILGSEPPSLREANPTVSRDLEAVVLTALEKDPNRRYQTALDFAGDLERVRKHEPVRARPVGVVRRLARWAARNRALAAALVALVAALAGGLIISLVLLDQAGTALANERVATKTAVEESERADRNLESFELLADARRLADLVQRSRVELWPARASMVPAMTRWLDEARDLIARAGLHRAAIAELETRAWRSESRPRGDPVDVMDLANAIARVAAGRSRVSEKHAASDDGDQGEVANLSSLLKHLESRRDALAAATPRPVLRFDDHRDQWRYDLEVAFLAGIDALEAKDEHGDTVDGMKRRLGLAQTLWIRSVAEYREGWGRAVDAIRSDARFGGFQLTPQAGLVPLGADPVSNLQEFADLQTGTVPVRDAHTHRLEYKEDAAIVFVLLPGGTARLGAQGEDPDMPNHDLLAERFESPINEVRLDPFFLAKHEMTQAQWVFVTGGNPSEHKPPKAPGTGPAYTLRHPVESVTFDGFRSLLARLGFRLPTEAQWEYACRAGTATPWSTGSDFHTLEGSANLADQSARRAGARFSGGDDWPELDDGFPYHAPVGSFRPNAYGLHDMHGNVWEWCEDCECPYAVPAREGDGLRMTEGFLRRTSRGGAFHVHMRYVRSSYRHAVVGTTANASFGVRPARPVETP